ncbi:hypothetical protein [Nocardia sp. NPDC057353]|uniref:hypothetical protein n=1 Tax=Nocardia sp. NPDC057353 TaxID=3346104 RepID=UPI00363E01D5
MKSVSFSRAREEWIVRGQTRRGGVDSQLILIEDELTTIRAADLRNALASASLHYEIAEAEALVSPVSLAYLDHDYGPFGNISFESEGGDLFLAFSQQVSWPEDGNEELAISQTRELLHPLIAAKRASLHSIEVDDRYSDPLSLFLRIRIQAAWRGRSARELYSVADDATQLCDAFTTSTIDRSTVANLIRGNAANLLVGQPEGNWLDAKSHEYDLSTLEGKISLAQSVSRFCNSEEGGLIIIGAHAKRVPGGEVITKIRGVPADPGRNARYLQVLNELVYPPPFGLRIDLVPVSELSSLILIDIPPQGEEMKPFLVHGAIRKDGRTEGAYISIVQRRGEGSVPITAPMIHASLAAGRALLRGAGSTRPAQVEPTAQ